MHGPGHGPAREADSFAGPASQTSLVLNWQAGSDNVGVHHYNVFLNGAKLAETTALTWTYTGLSCNTDYAMGLEVVDAAGNKSLLSEATWTVRTAACSGPADTTPPSPPSGLAVSAVSGTGLTLSWSPASDNVGVTAYEVFRNGTQVGSVTTTSSNQSGLTCGTSYTFGVEALDAAGNRSPRAQLTAATSACADTTPPSPPSGLAVSAVSGTGLTLSWSPASDNVGVTAYEVFRNGTQVGSVTTTSSNQSGLTCGTSYTFGVEALDAAGNRSPRAQLAAATAACTVPDTVPPAKPILSLGPASQTSLVLNWQAGSDNVGVHHYNVFLNGAKLAETTALTWTYTGLSCNTDYAMGLEVVDAAGNKSLLSEATWTVRTAHVVGLPTRRRRRLRLGWRSVLCRGRA